MILFFRVNKVVIFDVKSWGNRRALVEILTWKKIALAFYNRAGRRGLGTEIKVSKRKLLGFEGFDERDCVTN